MNLEKHGLKHLRGGYGVVMIEISIPSGSGAGRSLDRVIHKVVLHKIITRA